MKPSMQNKKPKEACSPLVAINIIIVSEIAATSFLYFKRRDKFRLVSFYFLLCWLAANYRLKVVWT